MNVLFWQHEYTFVMYLTPDWSENRYGETIFFEEIDKHLKESSKFKTGNEKYETLGKLYNGYLNYLARPLDISFLPFGL